MRAYRMHIPQSLESPRSLKYAEYARIIIDDEIARNTGKIAHIRGNCPDCDESIVFDANHAIYRNHIIIGCDGYFTLIDMISSYNPETGHIA